MNGFIQLPIMIIVLLISGGIISTYTITHKTTSTNESNNQTIEATSSAEVHTSQNLQAAQQLTTVKPIINPSPIFKPSPSPSVLPTPINTPTVTQSLVRLESISPNSTKYGEIITLKGSGFGSSGQYVIFTNPYGFTSGAGLVSWSDTEIKAYVPPTRGENKVQVEGPNGVKSNIYSLEVMSGQPYISSIPTEAKPGQEITISGSEFGLSTGVINLYGPNTSSSTAGNCSITSWSDTEIKCVIPSNFSTNSEYAVSVVTSDGRPASYKYINLK